MKTGLICAAALLAAFVPPAYARQTRPAQTPAPPADSAASTAWMLANIRPGAEWSVNYADPDGVVMLPTRVTMEKGHVLSLLRIERTRPAQVDGFTWRSAALVLDTECATEKQSQSRLVSARLTVFEGQNLTGQSQFTPPPAQGVLNTAAQTILSQQCDIAAADRIDGPIAAQEESGPVSLEPGALQAWADRAIKADGWTNPLFQVNKLTLASGLPARPDTGTVRFKVRHEYYTTAFNYSRRLRSESWEVMIDCRTSQFRITRFEYFARRNLRDRVGDTSPPTPELPVTRNSTVEAYHKLACAPIG